MNRTEILDELKKILAPYTIDKEQLAGINEDTDLIERPENKLG
jgi:acyl carrier protein